MKKETKMDRIVTDFGAVILSLQSKKYLKMAKKKDRDKFTWAVCILSRARWIIGEELKSL